MIWGRIETATSLPDAGFGPLQRSMAPAVSTRPSSATLPLITLLPPMKRATNSERGRS